MNTVWGNQVSGQALSIRTEQAAFRAGEPILLNLTLKNFGQNPVVAVVRSPWLDYDIQVREASGSTVPHTEFAAQMKETAQEGRRAQQSLPGGATLEDAIDLAQVCALKPGKYSVTASRLVNAAGAVTSNTLTFEVK
ncbi:MAG: hypothetical protein IT162_01100 [Bryobacterales bacterium]|nr:hypothetical protein [Bryobacterales bacterium]